MAGQLTFLMHYNDGVTIPYIEAIHSSDHKPISLY